MPPFSTAAAGRSRRRKSCAGIAVRRSSAPAIQGPKRRMAPMSSTDAIVMVPPRGSGTGCDSAITSSTNQTATPRASGRICFTSGPPNKARSTGSAARNEGTTTHTTRAANERVRPNGGPEGSDVTCMRAPRARMNWRLRATVSRNQCASARPRSKGITRAAERGARVRRMARRRSRVSARRRRRTAARPASSQNARGVVQTHARHGRERLGAAERLAPLQAE